MRQKDDRQARGEDLVTKNEVQTAIFRSEGVQTMAHLVQIIRLGER